MKKKPVLTEEALQALMTEDNNTEVVAEEAVTETEAVETKEVIEPAAESTIETDNDDQKLAELVQAEFDDFKTSAEEEITALKAEVNSHVEAAEAKTVEFTEQLTGLKDIVVGQISKMRTALSIAAVDMSEWAVDQILAEYESTTGEFVKNLPVGSVVPENEDKGETPVGSSVDVSNLKSLGF